MCTAYSSYTQDTLGTIVSAAHSAITLHVLHGPTNTLNTELDPAKIIQAILTTLNFKTHA